MKNLNKIKNITLVLLTILLGMLAWKTWIVGLENANIPENSWVYKLINKSDEKEKKSILNSDIITPSKISYSKSQKIYTAEYSLEVKTIFETMLNFLEKLFNTKTSLSEETEEEFLKALDNNILVLNYDNTINLELLNFKDRDMYLETIAITAKKIYIRESNTHKIYSFKHNYGDFFSDEIVGNSYSFAMGQSSLLPETPVYSGVSTFPIVKKQQNITDSDKTIKAFGYNPYTVKKYIQDDSQIFIENSSTIKINKNIEFLASDIRGGIIINNNTKIDKVQKSVEILEKIFPLKTFVLDEIYYDETTKREIIYIRESINGISVYTDEKFASFEFLGNVLVRANIQILEYIIDTEKTYILPLRQAMYATNKKHIALFYKEINGVLKPVWLGE